MSLLTLPAGYKFQESAKVSEQIETAAEAVAEYNLLGDDDELITCAQAAELIGCSRPSIQNWVKNQNIPSEKHGSRRYLRKSVCEIVKDLRDLHGNHWLAFATWEASPESDDHDETVVEEESPPDEGEIFISTRELLSHARQAREDGRHEAASELFHIICTKYQF